MFLRAAEIVLRKHPDAGFVIAGEGGLMEDLRQMSRDLGIDDSVYFIGRCRQVPELLSLAEVGVLSSKAEGFSNSILEYMAAGKPVVATNVGGAAEAIVEGETGYLVESDDHTTMAARLRELLRNDVVARVMGAEGRRRVERQFSTQNQLQLTKDLYNTLF
jgi:glycosyltransferase involved in cell wall biosynthesis